MQSKRMSRTHPLLLSMAMFAAACTLIAPAAAQVIPPHWDNAIGQPGMNGPVHALEVFNGELIAGGAFTTAGGVTVNHIARWDGSSWHPLGSGMSHMVTSLTVYNGQLIAGGAFITAGGQTANRIARWNGSQWSPLGSGANSTVRALTVFNNDLYAGGSFAFAGGQQVNFIARWNGSQWSSLGLGMNSTVYALAVSNDGTGSALFAGGSFTSAGGGQGGGGIPANYIAKWSGSQWSALGSGVTGGEFPTVLTIAPYDDGSGAALFVGGEFAFAGGQTSNNIARWNGSQWSPLGAGMNAFVRKLVS